MMPVLPDDQGEKMMEVANEKYIYIYVLKKEKKLLFLFK
jgi:hypothetical protein